MLGNLEQMLMSSRGIWQTLADLERKVAPLDRPSVKFVADAAGTTEVPAAAETTAAPRASLTPSQRAWRNNFLLGAVVGAFLPGVSLAVLLTVYAFDSGQSPPVIWEAFLLGILVGTAFTATVILDLSLDLVLLKDTIE